MSDEPKPSLNGSNGPSVPFVPDRSAKPSLHSDTAREESSQTHSEVQRQLLEEERREREAKEMEERERRREEEERKHQEKKRLERQKAEEEEEEDKENRTWEESRRRGKEQTCDTPSKSMSLDSPAPNHLVSDIKVSGRTTCGLMSLSRLLQTFTLVKFSRWAVGRFQGHSSRQMIALFVVLAR